MLRTRIDNVTQRRHISDQQVYEKKKKKVCVTNHQGTANQNHNEILSYTYQDVSNKGWPLSKKSKGPVLGRCGELEHLHAVTRNAKWCSCLGKQYAGSSKN